MMTLSGSGCSGLPPPARPTLAARCVPVRGPGGTFVLWVREGGTLELCASLTGSCCLASKAARRALRRCTSAHNAAMSASFSCSESRVRSGKLSMLSLSDTATLLVKRVVPSGGLSNYDARTTVVEPDAKGHPRIHRINYEIHVLQALRERLRCKEIWVPGAQRYRNPEEDLPTDFPEARDTYYQALEQPLDPDTSLTRLQQQMHQALQTLDTGMPQNPGVKILLRPKGWIRVSPLERLPEPTNLAHLKAEITRRWPMTSLLDVLKETELRVGLTPHFVETGTRVGLDEATLQRRLLLCLFGLGTNTGLKRVCATTPEEQYHDLLYVRRCYVHPEALRNAIAHVVNAIFRSRATHIWGEGTTACASDSKQFGAWDQNLLTEWHLRYGGRGVMVYWHVEKRAVCIYSQLKTVSSSEVAAMLEGVLRHGTDMRVEKQSVDTQGQSAVAFAFCPLLNVQLLPRLKGIHRQKLYRPTTGQPDAYPHLQAILTRPIRWELIRQQYDQMIKYATALRVGPPMRRPFSNG